MLPPELRRLDHTQIIEAINRLCKLLRCPRPSCECCIQDLVDSLITRQCCERDIRVVLENLTNQAYDHNKILTEDDFVEALINFAHQPL
jgi:hypothetical protein